LRRSIPLEYFFTVCGLPVAGDSYWPSKRPCGDRLANPQANGKQARSLNMTSVPHGKNLKTTPSYFPGLNLHVISIRVSHDTVPFRIKQQSLENLVLSQTKLTKFLPDYKLCQLFFFCHSAKDFIMEVVSTFLQYC